MKTILPHPQPADEDNQVMKSVNKAPPSATGFGVGTGREPHSEPSGHPLILHWIGYCKNMGLNLLQPLLGRQQ